MFWFSNSLYLKSPHPHAVHILSLWDQDDTEQKGHMILVLVFFSMYVRI